VDSLTGRHDDVSCSCRIDYVNEIVAFRNGRPPTTSVACRGTRPDDLLLLLVVDARVRHTSQIACPAARTRLPASDDWNVGCVLHSRIELDDADDIRLPVSLLSCLLLSFLAPSSSRPTQVPVESLRGGS